MAYLSWILIVAGILHSHYIIIINLIDMADLSLEELTFTMVVFSGSVEKTRISPNLCCLRVGGDESLFDLRIFFFPNLFDSVRLGTFLVHPL